MTRFDDDILFRGYVSLTGGVNLPAASVADANVAADAAVAATKLQHQHRAAYAQESATGAASESRTIHVVVGATGTLQKFSAGCVVANIGDDTVTVDLHINGVTALSAVITLSSSESAYDVVDATLSTTAVTVDDVLEVVITAVHATGTLGKGVFASLDLFEDAA